jgi:2-keto-4-pentenoate hydratase/2-oxohepta-3-ene-1,7-dioic acid hydratase in catechol pathway
MRLVTFVGKSGESFGLYKDDGIVDLRSRLGVSGLRDLLAQDRLGDAAAHANDKADVPHRQVTLLPVIPDPKHLFCIGVNYADHLREVQAAGVNRPFPKEPSVFIRYPDSLVGHDQPLLMPKASSDFDYEAELAIVIGRGGRYITEADALSHIAGYSCFNDGSIRDWQFHTTQVTPGKNFEATGSFGPWMVSADEISDPHSLDIQLRLNGKVEQRSNTSQLLFSLNKIIAYLSSILPLAPGDVIATGTPAGVGFSRKPPLFMKPGDLCEIEIQGVGILANRIARA